VVVAIPFEAFNRQDFEAVLILCHPQGEFRPALDLVESGIAEPSYYGHAGYMASMSDWLSAWVDFLIEPQELIDLGDRVVVLAKRSAWAWAAALLSIGTSLPFTT
jgi:hypothetical protein